jgi:hypothetical protein
VLSFGCGSTAAAGSVPESASIAPSSSIAFVTLESDDGSAQWQNADALLALVPKARQSLVDAVESSLSEEGLSWAEDVRPAIGDEVVVVVTKDKRPVVLVRPDSAQKLQALLAEDDDPSVTGLVAGWTAVAEAQADIDAYRTSLAAGTLESNESFTVAMKAFPDESLGRAWVDISSLTSEINAAVRKEGLGEDLDIEFDAAAAAVSAEADGLLVVASAHGPNGTGTTQYEPKLVDRIPSDAVAVLSFGGTQEVLDRIRRSAGLDKLSSQAEDLTGVSLERLFDAVSGEGALYVRKGAGGSIPEVTIVLSPPDAQKTFETVDRIVRRVAQDADLQLETTNDLGVEVTRFSVEDLTVEYAKLDGDTVIVTTSGRGIASFRSDGPKVGDSDAFRQAADRVDLGDRTSGFLYVDIDGLVPFVEDLRGEQLGGDVRDGLAKVDSFILETSGDGKTTSIGGFVRVNQP